MKKATCRIISLGLSLTLSTYALLAKSNSNTFPSGITISPASDFTIDCIEDYFPVLEEWLEDVGGARLVSNDCDVDDNVEWDYGPTVYDAGCGGSETYTVTFVATNSCGDAIGTTASFIILDNNAPEIHAPATNIPYSCSNPLPSAWASDACGEVDFVENASPHEVDYCNGYSVSYSWQATDECGNSSTLNRSYTIAGDNSPPTITPRNNSPLRGISNGELIHVSCMNNVDNWDPNAFSVSDVTTYDNCSAVQVRLEKEQMNVGDCNSAGYISKWRHTWIATDECGNAATFEFFTEVRDNRPPTFSYVPEDIVTDCRNIPEPEQAWAFDVCSSVEIDFKQERLPSDCAGESIILRTWTATDGCGNQSFAQQRIEVVDHNPPRIFIQDPALRGLESGDTVELECESWNELYYGADAIFANDDCSVFSDVQYDLRLEHFPTCNEDGHFARATSTWIASDECGNATELVLYFLVGDNTAPTLEGVPANICAPILPPVVEVTATDNCSDIEITFEETDAQQGDDGTIFVERKWTAFDECGNADVGIQKITIEDRVPPEVRIVYPGLEDIPIGGEATVPFDCNGDSLGVPLFTRDDFEVTDNVGVQEVTWETTFIIAGNCPRDNYLYKVVLSVTAVDKCGNFTRYSILLSIVDQTPPTFEYFAPRLTLSCGTEIPMLEALDDCGGPVDLSFVDTYLSQGSCTGEEEALIRDWTAVDQCGNTTTAKQTIHLIDNMGPEFINFPEDACELPAPDPVEVMAIDACLNDTIFASLTQDTLVTNCGLTIQRTYSATDRCGNTSTKVQTIIEMDDTPPELTFVHPRLENLISGQTIEQNCVDFQDDLFPDLGEEAVTAEDNCEGNIDLQLIVKLVDTGSCSEDGYLERYQYSWQATDPCGNMSELIIFINAVDNFPPIFSYNPNDTTIYCESPIPSASDIVVADGCSEFTVDFEESFHTISPTIEQIRRNWKATDACGNMSEADQVITVLTTDLRGTFVGSEVVDCGSTGNSMGIQVSGGVAPYTYHWAIVDGDALMTAGQSTATLEYSIGGSALNLAVKITDAIGCIVMEYIHIECEGDGVVLPTPPEEYEDNAESALTHFTLLPNPSSEDAYLDLDTGEEGLTVVRVQNLFGETVFQQSWPDPPVTRVKLPVANLVDGIYTVSVQVERHPVLTKQLVIMH